MKLNKIVILSFGLVLAIGTFIGCKKDEKNIGTSLIENKGGYSNDKTEYVLNSNELGNEDKISISIPDNMIALEDNDENDNAYISLYNVAEDGIATKDDYVLTYKLIEENSIENDKEDTKNLYKNIYKDLQISEIKEGTKDDVTYKYYTVSYVGDGENLTDYVFELKINDTTLLAKVGTVFYPLSMDFDAVLDLALSNIEK